MDTENALAEILKDVFGEECWDDNVYETARRVMGYWKENCPPCNEPFQFTTFPAIVNQMIIVKNIEFASMCAHHLLPFYGLVSIGYIPNKLMVGLSKIPRLVHYWAHRPSTQEAFTQLIAADLKARLECHGVAAVVRTTHTCMACRGVRAVNASMVTSEMRGVFLTSGEARSEFLNLIGDK